MHGDLKLDNILVKQTGKSDIKLIDFGMAEYDQEDETALIQALHYRAPEVILGAKYGRQVDMWSFGVILTELTGKTVPEGSDESDQLARGWKCLEYHLRSSWSFVVGQRISSRMENHALPIARLTPSQALVHPFITNKIPSPDDNEKSAFSPAVEDSQPDSAVTRGTYKERRVTNKRKRSELAD
ncbi:Dual specificity tyrosine-phosphorylation-regulated kinase 2 [Orchesella cincta]|uniref:Dual specificity tyrosine-phosphorylation-regulated kinase 2 n=1 Tax=Orchesella cincta TaxID=48709 RepID=A0A1D2M5S9_ORCCI|nr:Dual specificity tyrosine-phosphorylation-regulated kinase 2 [Orchesella cincta]